MFRTVSLASKFPGYTDWSQLIKAISLLFKDLELVAPTFTSLPVTLKFCFRPHQYVNFRQTVSLRSVDEP
jgi:hypothetical protein